MTSTKSFSNSFPKLFFIELWQKRSAVLLALIASCGTIFVSMMNYYYPLIERIFSPTGFSQTQSMTNQSVGLGLKDLTVEIFRNSAMSIAVLNVLIFIFAHYLFSYLYKKQKLDFYHAIPVTRRNMLLVRYLMGIGVIVFSFALNTGILAISKGMAENNLLGTFDLASVATQLMQGMMIVICFFTFYMVAAVTAGNAVQYVLIAISLGAVGKLVDIILFYPVGRLFGYSANASWLSYVFPNYTQVNMINGEPASWWSILSLAVVSVLLLLLSFYFYRKRKSECAEQLVSSPAVICACVFIVQMIAFVVAISIIESNTFMVLLAGISACAITGVILQLVFTRGQNKRWKQLIIQGCVAVAIGTGIVAFTATGGLGYDSRIPTIDEIEQVAIGTHYYNRIEHVGVILTTISNGSSYTQVVETKMNQERKTIEATLQFHQKMIELGKDKTLTSYTLGGEIEVVYQLKDGTKVTRIFPSAVYTKELEATVGITKLFDTGEKYYSDPQYNLAYEAQQSLLRSKEYLLHNTGATLNDSGNGVIEISTLGIDSNERAQINAVMNALAMDVLAPDDGTKVHAHKERSDNVIHEQSGMLQLDVFFFAGETTQAEKDNYFARTVESKKNSEVKDRVQAIYMDQGKLRRDSIFVPSSYVNTIAAICNYTGYTEKEMHSYFEELERTNSLHELTKEEKIASYNDLKSVVAK